MTAERAGKEPASIRGILKKLIGKLGGKGALTEEAFAAAWSDAAGAAAAAHSKPVSIRRSRLTVNVDDSGWLYELTIKKRDIMERLEGRLGGRKLKDIRFRIGDVKGKN